MVSRKTNPGVSPKIFLWHRPRESYFTTPMIRAIYWQNPCLGRTTSSCRPCQSWDSWRQVAQVTSTSQLTLALLLTDCSLGKPPKSGQISFKTVPLEDGKNIWTFQKIYPILSWPQQVKFLTMLEDASLTILCTPCLVKRHVRFLSSSSWFRNWDWLWWAV